MRIYWNDDWGFTTQFSDHLVTDEFDQGSLERVRIPHAVAMTPYHYYDSAVCEMVSGYRREFIAPEEWRDKKVVLTMEGAAHEAVIFVNGQRVWKHKCGYTPIICEISPYLRYGEKNVLAVRLDSRETLNQPPFGKAVEEMTYGGIYRDVYIDVHDRYYIKDVELMQEHVLDTTKILRSRITLNEEPDDYLIRQSLLDSDGHAVVHYSELQSLEISSGITDVELWNPEEPRLYILKTELLMGGVQVDSHQIRIGFREAVFRPDGFYLNGKKRKLRGLNRHQSYPYVGYAMPERVQKRDVDILLRELGVNLVRIAHAPQSQDFLDACDEKGLMVCADISAGWDSGDEVWKDIEDRNTEEMMRLYQHHPSVIFCGIPGQGEYPDIRLQNPGAGKKASGCLFGALQGKAASVKMYDREAIRLDAALECAGMMNACYAETDVAGGCGWSMTDYAVHREFGCGDGICYGGVLDLFRNPKLSAAVYASQSDECPYLTIGSTVELGEQPACNIGTVYAFTNADSVKVYRNDAFVTECFPNRDAGNPYAALPHPPIQIDDLIGEWMETQEKYSHRTCERIKKVLRGISEYGMDDLPLRYRMVRIRLALTGFIGRRKITELYDRYALHRNGMVTVFRFDAIRDGAVVATVTRAPGKRRELHVETDTELLVENHSYDVASIRITMCDENGNRLSYDQEPVTLRTEGAISLIGPDVISLQGGCLGTYVKTVGESGEGKLYVTSGTEEKVLTFNCLA